MLLGGFVQAVSQFVGETVAVVGVAAPAGGVVPADKPVGNVNVALDILGRSALLQVVGNVARSHGRSRRGVHPCPVNYLKLINTKRGITDCDTPK